MDLNKYKQKNKILFLIFALTFLLYGNTIKNNYSLDDNYVTVTTPENPNNPRIAKGLKGIPKIFSTHYMESKEQTFEYRPLALTTFAIEYHFFGSNPHVSHFFNVLLYAISNMILFLVLLNLFKNYDILFPLLITILFTAHPIHTEVVASIKSRDEILSFLFGISAMNFALKYFENKGLKNVLLTFLFLIAALLCKKTAILFIGLIPLTYYFFFSIKPKQFFSILGVLLVAITCFVLLKKAMIDANSANRTFAFFENPLFYEKNILTRIPFAFYSIGYYIKLLIFPYPLCCYYGYSTIPFVEWTTTLMILSLIFHSGLVLYVLKHIKEKSMLVYGIIIYFIGVFPFSNIYSLATGVIGERYIYFASLGYCVIVVFLLGKFLKVDLNNKTKKISPVFLFIVTVICIVYSGLTISRNTKWVDEITLFRNDCKNFKNSCNLHYITGNKLYTAIFTTPPGPKQDSIINETKFHLGQAVSLMEEGVKKYPQDFTTLNNIGTIYVNVFKDSKKAQPFFKKAMIVKPDNVQTQYNFAFCYEKRNLKDSAIWVYEKIIKTNTDYLPAYIQLRELYLNKQEYKKTIACDKKSIELSPLEARLHINLGNVYLLDKDTLSGVEEFETAVNLEPQNLGLRNQIITFLKSAGYSQKAKKLEEK